MSDEETPAPETPVADAPEAAPSEPSEPDYFAAALAAVGEDEPEKAAETPATEDAPAAPETPVAAEADAAPTENAEEPEKPVSDAWAAVASRERELTKQSDAVRATEAGFVEREATLKAQETAQSKLLDAVKAIQSGDPVTAFETLGVKWEEMLTRAMNGGIANQKPDLSPLEDQIKAQAQQLEDYKREQAETNQASKLENARRGITHEVNSAEGDRWELLKATPDFAGEVLAYVKGHYEQNPAVGLTMEQAADRLEEVLLSDLQKHATSAKARALFGTPAEPTTPATQPSQHATQGTGSDATTAPHSPTLTNAASAEITSRDGHTDFSAEACTARALAVQD